MIPFAMRLLCAGVLLFLVSASPVVSHTTVFGPILSEKPAVPAAACTHHVAPDGDDGNSGTGSLHDAAWRTIMYAVAQLSAGDVLCIAPGTYTESTILMTASGTEAEPIIIKRVGSGTVTITAAPGVREMVILHGSDYVIIDGITFTRAVANWPAGVYPWILFRNNADHTIFQNNTITSEQRAPSQGGISLWDFYFARRHEVIGITGSTDNQILYNEISHVSKGVRVYGIDHRTAIIRGNYIHDTFVHAVEIAPPNGCAADPLPPQAILIENNLFEGSFIQDGIQFFTQPSSQPPPCNGTITHTGSIIRNNIFRNNNENAIDLKGAAHILIEKNIMYGTDGDNDGPYQCSGFGECVDAVSYFSDRGSHAVITRGAGTISEANIIRRNIIYDNPALDPNRGYKIYNNTIINNNHDFRGSHTQPQGTPSNFFAVSGSRNRPDITIKNNIIAQHNNAELAFELPMANLEVRNNLYWNTGGVRFKTTYRNGGPGDDSGQVNFTVWRAESGDEGSIIAAPQLVNVPDTFRPEGDHTQYNFSLRGSSPAIDTGAPLTIARTDGSGMTLPVEDARYFYTSRGLLPEEDDTIQVGTDPTNTAQIRTIDYATHTLTLSKPLTWAAGDEVHMPYYGSSPDIGAYEYRGIDGDINGDGGVTIIDLSILLANFGKTPAGKGEGDVNGDAIVSVSDMAILLSNFGA